MAACAASLESQLWKTAQQADTIGAYEGFLERCPSGDLAPKARDRLQALRETLQGLQTVRVVVDESYTAGPVHAAIEGVKLPFAEATAELLRGVHLEVVFAADVSADGELHVLVEGQALRKTYAPTDERALTTRGALTLQYAGADLRGSMALRTPTGTLYERSFEGRLTPPDRLGSERYPTPDDAPFSPLFETTFLPVATRMVGDLYGAGPLLPILRDGTLASRTAAATALGLLADSTATRDLLEVLETTANFGLKGAIVTALGDICTGAFTNNQELLSSVIRAGEMSGERIWQLPMYEEYKEQNKSQVADVKNTGGRKAGSIAAAQFLAEFSADTPWVHLDIAGTSMSDKEAGYQIKGATGVPVRTLVNLAMALAEEK